MVATHPVRQAFEGGPEEGRGSVEHEFWARHQDKCATGSQFKPLLDALVRRVRVLAEEQHIDAWSYERKLREAEEVLGDLAFALRANWKEPPDGRFWYGFDASQLRQRPESWSDASPIDPRLLDAATARYLERPWLQINGLDWYIINGFVSDEVLRLSNDIKSGIGNGEINWAYIFSGGNHLSMMCWQMGLGVTKFVLNWIFAPALAGLSYYLGYINIGNWILGLFGILIVFRIILLPGRFVRRRAQRRQAAEWDDVLKRLIQIQQSCQANTLNPTLLRKRIAEAERGEALVRPAVYSILDRAISRDPAVFTISG